MGKRFRLQVKNLDRVIKRLDSLGGNSKEIADKALRETFEIVTEKAAESAMNANLPAGGRYATGATAGSLKTDADVEWSGLVAKTDTGFSIKGGGLPSIFMIYGTPRYMKNQKMYNAFYGSATKKQIVKAQENAFYDEINRLMGV